MGSVTFEELPHRWDPLAVRWRLMCHRHAAQRLMDGQTSRRVAPVPAPDAGHAAGGRSGGWERVSAELALRTWLAL